MNEEMRKAFEEAMKFKKCQEQPSEEFCSKYIKEDENCGDCPYYIKEVQGIESEVKVLDFALKLFEEGKLDNL